MSTTETISLAIAVLAFLASAIAVYYTAKQTKVAIDTLAASQQIERGNAVIHFTGRFFDLVKGGDPAEQLENPEWAYNFWSLHATEFYFFHHGILPSFMYSLWMIDMASLYGGPGGAAVWQSHENYLDMYSVNYPEMLLFFMRIFEISNDVTDKKERNHAVAEYVSRWIEDNKKLDVV